MNFKRLKGTADVLPADSYKWQHVEKTLLETAALYGFSEIRFPVFEDSRLFQRSVGDTTDIVQKEMYRFTTKGGDDITLRPEGTAGAARAFLENGLHNESMPVKTCYLVSCYRYEKPQAGRLREFHQFGAEMYGAASFLADVEVIALANALLRSVGVTQLSLHINSIGCPECRGQYQQKLREYFEERKGELCATCLDRLERNPMRILDCKSPVCSEIAKGAPKVLDYLCSECREHFEGVKEGLSSLGIAYTVNTDIVRGLDYYTRTVFEFTTDTIGAQGTVCGGGRYDGLVEELSGPHTPALGFAMGLERLLMVMEAAGVPFPPKKTCEIYIASMGEAAAKQAAKLCEKLRAEGFAAECDTMGRSLKAQMKYADRIGARRSLVLGENELQSGMAVLKNMETGDRREIGWSRLTEEIYEETIRSALGELTESVEQLES